MKKPSKLMRVRESIFVGFFILLPKGILTFLFFYFLKFFAELIGIQIRFWSFISDFIPVNIEIFRLIGTIFLFFLPYIVGRYSLSRLSKEKVRIKSEKKAIFIKGGYKRILYGEFGNGPNNMPIPAVVVGRTKKNGELLLSIIPIKLAIPNPRWIFLEDSEIIETSFKELWNFYRSFGSLNPVDLISRSWTEKEYYEIPNNDDD